MNALRNGSRFNLLPISDISREMSRLFDTDLTSEKCGSCTAPVSIWEDDTHYHLEFDVPGVNSEDVDLKIRENVLHMSATRPVKGDVQFLRQERAFGMVERQFTLPARIDDSAIEAELVNGVLNVTVAKAPESQVKKIEVKAKSK